MSLDVWAAANGAGRGGRRAAISPGFCHSAPSDAPAARLEAPGKTGKNDHCGITTPGAACGFFPARSTTMSANPVPEHYRSGSTYLIGEDAAQAIDFYGAAFGAEEVFRQP